MKREITSADILSLEDYARVRDEKRAAMRVKKARRRLSVGPYATFYFESYDTMWMQVQEMLRVEKGGDAQLKDELAAYNPMIPNGDELTATVMFEIPDAARRAAILATLGGVEHKMEIRVGHQIIKGAPERDLAYTSEEGKASSVQFMHFLFTKEQIAAFRDSQTESMVAITHPQYGHIAVMPKEMREELAGDFD